MASNQSPEEDAGWDVYGLNIMRSQFNKSTTTSDSTMDFGWNESTATQQPETPAQTAQDSSTTRSTGYAHEHEKPIFLWDSDYGNRFSG
jgi:hypothetical protein